MKIFMLRVAVGGILVWTSLMVLLFGMNELEKLVDRVDRLFDRSMGYE